MEGKRVNSTFAALLILVVLLALGFVWLREGESLQDTYEYGSDSVQDIKKLEIALEKLEQEGDQTPDF